MGQEQHRGTYITKQGSMKLLLQKEKTDTAITAATSALRIRLQPDVSKMQFRALLSDFHCKDSAFQRVVQQIATREMRFQGDLEVHTLIPEGYAEVAFPIEGYLTINNKRRFVKLTGNLFSLGHANSYQAQLRVSTRLTLSEFGLKRYLPDFTDRFYILIYHSVLRPSH